MPPRAVPRQRGVPVPGADWFHVLLKGATTAVEPNCFILPVAGSPAAHLERVYCYELYHQLRSRWPTTTPLEVNAEVPKTGNRVIKAKYIPDLLIHEPGSMANNFAAIEVKRAGAPGKGLRKDLRTLASLKRKGYQRGILLVFGEGAEFTAQKAATLRGRVKAAGDVEVWVHSTPAQEASVLRNVGRNCL